MKKVFEKQKQFQELLKNDISTQEYKNQMFLGLFEESVELMKETKFKAHKKHQVFNEKAFLEECVDLQLYLINLVITSSNYEEFLKLIEEKQNKNTERQQDGY